MDKGIGDIIEADKPKSKEDIQPADAVSVAASDVTVETEASLVITEPVEKLPSADSIPPISSYQIKPTLIDKFKANPVKEVIRNVLTEVLSGQAYSSEMAKRWTIKIANEINTRVRELKMKRYKHIAEVVLGEHKGAGVKCGVRCLWDSETDGYTSDIFTRTLVLAVIAALATRVVCMPSAAITRDDFQPLGEKISKREAPEESHIQKRSIIRDSEILLPGGEPITLVDSNDDLEAASSSIVFRPLFSYRQDDIRRRRSGRSINQEQLQDQDIDVAESSIVFLPHFRRGSRFQRSAQDVPADVAEEAKVDDDMAAAESGIVFLPHFRRGGRFRRTVEEAALDSDQEAKVDEDMAAAESGIVFLPHFRRGGRFKRSAQEASADVAQKMEIDDDMSSAESGIVFLPHFRRGGRLQRSVEEAPIDAVHEPKADDDMTAAESGVVFLPHFRKSGRYQRSVQSDVLPKADDLDDMTGAESSVVFIPHFRRSGRFQRSVAAEEDHKPEEVDDMDGQESGVVFLPHFRRGGRVTRDAKVQDDVKTDDDMETAGSSIVFLPHFRNSGFRRQ